MYRIALKSGAAWLLGVSLGVFITPALNADYLGAETVRAFIDPASQPVIAIAHN